MAKAEVRQSIFRVLSDLIKSDNIITLDELDGLDGACGKYSITQEDKEAGYGITLGAAMATIARQGESLKRKVLATMRDIALDDNECSRAEALLIWAMDSICHDPSARMVSMEFKNRPLLRTQLLYVENRKTIPARVDLENDRKFEEMSRIVKMGGLELVYIPRVARHFKMYGTKEKEKGFQDLKRVLRLVSPQSSDSDITNAIFSLQGMNSKYFYNHILRGKLEMNLNVDNPAWVIRMPDSVVGGAGYANFFCVDVQDDIRGQLTGFVDSLNRYQTSYSVTVNDGADRKDTFRYNGFYKALLDVMSVKKNDKWDLHIRLYGDGGVDRFEYLDEKTGTMKKCVMTISRGSYEYPIPLSGRDVAFYLLLLCASAAEQKGVDFSNPDLKDVTEQRYREIYASVSRRSKDIPEVWIPETRIPMRSRVAAAINDSEIAKHSSLQSVYLPEGNTSGFLHVQIEPERVFIDSHTGSKPLMESGLYSRYLTPRKKLTSPE